MVDPVTKNWSTDVVLPFRNVRAPLLGNGAPGQARAQSHNYPFRPDSDEPETCLNQKRRFQFEPVMMRQDCDSAAVWLTSVEMRSAGKPVSSLPLSKTGFCLASTGSQCRIQVSKPLLASNSGDADP